MVLFKSCPKCMTGDLIKAEDMFGAYLECMQCGFVKDLTQVQQPAAQPVEASDVDALPGPLQSA